MYIGYFPITGDPIHHGHIYGALKVIEILCLESVYFQLCGDLNNYKPTKASKHHRHEMAKLAIKDFEPLIQYTSIGYNNNLVGEENFVEFINQHKFSNIIKFYYITGADNGDTVIKRFFVNQNKIKKPYEIVFLTRKSYPIKGKYKKIIYENDFSSSLFRSHINNNIVQKSVLEYCINHHLYGY